MSGRLKTLSTGLDIVSISRIGRASLHPRFLPRVCTGAEIESGAGLLAPVRFYALLFAAKEATAKALGTGFGRGFGFTDIEVCFDKVGNRSVLRTGRSLFPRADRYENASLKLHNAAAVRLAGRSLFLSLSTSDDLAVAYVLIE